MGRYGQDGGDDKVIGGMVKDGDDIMDGNSGGNEEGNNRPT